VRNVTVDSFDIGIEIREGGSNHLEAVNLKSSGGFLCSVGKGLRLINTTDNHVNRSNISGNGNWGVQLINSSGNQMNGNQIVDNRSRPGAPTGNIGLLSSHQNVISGNDLSRGGLYGIRAEESNGNVIFRNRLKDNGIPSGIGIGILLDRSENNLVHSNLVDREPVTTPPAESGFRGIVVSQGATQNVITANRVFIQFGVGILLDQNATQNVILGNRAKNNNPWDAQDDNTGCDANIWRANQFNRVNQSCIR
jgi:parallel beta-helix repeat protein